MRMVHAPVPLPSTPYALKLIAQAAALPLRDAAFALWRYRDAFIREAEAQAPEDLSDRTLALAYGRLLADGMVQDRVAAPTSGNTLRLRQAHPDASERDVREAILAAVAFTDAFNDCFSAPDDDLQRAAERAVARAARQHSGFSQSTLDDAANWLAQSMR